MSSRLHDSNATAQEGDDVFWHSVSQPTTKAHGTDVPPTKPRQASPAAWLAFGDYLWHVADDITQRRD